MTSAFCFTLLTTILLRVAQAQQYAGDFIDNTLPNVPGSEIAFWKIHDGMKSNNLTLINYINHSSDGNRLVPWKLKRAVVMVHGLNRDPGTYESNMLSALSQVPNSDINTDTVAVVAPYFPNGDDKASGYPWVNGLKPTQGSVTNCLVWSGSQWSAGGNNQYPWTSSKNISSYTVLDQMVQYFDNKTMFPNIAQIVIAGHSLGAQAVQRYAAIGQPGSTQTPVSYWVANPNSYVWLSTDRPLSTASCPIYDTYREGYTNFIQYPMTYGTALVASGHSAILANYNSKAINYARGTLDLGDDSSSCAPFTTGANRNERFFNFIKAFPPSCENPSNGPCDTVDFVASGHDGGAMMASAAGQARLFTDNFYGNGNRSYDFGYPRQQAGDDPYPNTALNSSTSAINNNTYTGNMTYWGCWSDQNPRSLTNMTYQGGSNGVESCTAMCASGNNTIAGVENGDQCFCGSSLGYLATEVIDSSCGTPCAGNSSEICGSGNRLSLYSNGRPVVNAAPGTPETILDEWYYTACAVDNAGGVRALGGSSTSSPAMTLEMCGAFCRGYQYFGTEYSSECYCGNGLGSYSSVAAFNDCNMLCAGDGTEFCGSGNRLTIYKNTSWVTPSGTTTSTATGLSMSADGPSCPASNATTTVSNGKSFLVECGIDHAGGDLKSLTANTLQACIDACALTSQCVDISFSGTACYLKSNLGAAVSNAGIWGAKLLTSTPSSTSLNSTLVSATLATMVTTISLTGTTGSLASMTSISSVVSPSATSSAVADCPSSNKTQVISSGMTFVVECGIDHAGGDLTSLSVSSFQQCIDACALNPACVDVSFSGSACYLKSAVGAPVNNGVWGARLISGSGSSTISGPVSASATTSTISVSASNATLISSSSMQPSTSALSSSTVTTSSSGPSGATPSAISCPASNSTTYASGGKDFVIECGIDHAAGDMSSLSVNSFADCIAACASAIGCVDVSLSGSACYLKSSVGSPIYNGVWGARLVELAPSSTAASSTTSTGSASPASSLNSLPVSVIHSSSAGAPSTTSTFNISDSSNSNLPGSSASISSVPGPGMSKITATTSSVVIFSTLAFTTVSSTNSSSFGLATLSNSTISTLSSTIFQPFKSSSPSPAMQTNFTSSTSIVSIASVRISSTANSNATTLTSSSTSSLVTTRISTSSSSSLLIAPTAIISMTPSTVLSDTTTSLSTGQASSSSTATPMTTSVSSMPGSNPPALTSSTSSISQTSSALAGINSDSTASSVPTSFTSSTIPSTIQTTSKPFTTFSTLTTTTSTTPTPTLLTCPTSNSTLYTGPHGHVFQIECYVDHQGGDMSWSYVSNFTQCMQNCDAAPGCVDVSLSGAACYLKRELGRRVGGSEVWGGEGGWKCDGLVRGRKRVQEGKG